MENCFVHLGLAQNNRAIMATPTGPRPLARAPPLPSLTASRARHSRTIADTDPPPSTVAA
jgi:hypothetical protein